MVDSRWDIKIEASMEEKTSTERYDRGMLHIDSNSKFVADIWEDKILDISYNNSFFHCCYYSIFAVYWISAHS